MRSTSHVRRRSQTRIYACTHKHKYLHTETPTHTDTYAYTRTPTYTHTHTYTFIYASEHAIQNRSHEMFVSHTCSFYTFWRHLIFLTKVYFFLHYDESPVAFVVNVRDQNLCSFAVSETVKLFSTF